LNGLASGTNWVFRDESCHMNFAFAVIDQVRREDPDLFDDDLAQKVNEMIEEAVEVEYAFAEDLLSHGIPGMSLRDMREYLQYVADQRLVTLGLQKRFGSQNPFGFMELQDVQELTNFFERTVSAYQTAVDGEVTLDDDFGGSTTRSGRPPAPGRGPSGAPRRRLTVRRVRAGFARR